MGPKPASSVLTPQQEAIALFESKPGYPSMIDCALGKPSFLIFPAQPCIAVSNDTALAAYLN
jgi:hypothetical protein